VQEQRREKETGTLVKYRFSLLALFITTILTDQLSKIIIDQTFELFDVKRIIPYVLNIRYIRNPGVAFGIHLGHPSIMLLLNMFIIVVLIYLFFKDNILAGSLTGKIGMVFVLGGAVGNLIDRLRMGEVIDFIQMGIGRYTWPVYNLADIYVTIGMALLIYIYLFKAEARETPTPLTQ
jgi:signal peptidase II